MIVLAETESADDVRRCARPGRARRPSRSIQSLQGLARLAEIAAVLVWRSPAFGALDLDVVVGMRFRNSSSSCTAASRRPR